jgi:hypothetical protein
MPGAGRELSVAGCWLSEFFRVQPTTYIQNAIGALASMLEFSCMSTADIIAELPRLSPAELAEVQAKLKELVETSRSSASPRPSAAHPARIHSPRLVVHEQAKDFIKQIVELAPDAKV